ncbi:hypothetical protein SCUCBS95973_008137 [Sporothrix curviconia]|uniref:Uncharacterized protein n=1 Tax=Sporothrix curviconia TaxID=1260050 RepID=A0ABP0CJ35_9PEZI
MVKGFLSRVVPQGAFFRSLFQSAFTFSVSEDLLTSATFNFANPRHHVVGADCVSQTIPAREVKGLSDEEILALFTSGFFGGFVFRAESWVLNLLGARYLPARYTAFRPGPDAVIVRRASAIPNRSLLPVGSLLFNSFLLVDKHAKTEAETETLSSEKISSKTLAAGSEASSYVDYGFGSDEARFAGCHRIKVTRLAPADNGERADGGQVRIDLEHFRCNPQENKPSWAEKHQTLHYVYAKSLFANGMQALLAR